MKVNIEELIFNKLKGNYKHYCPDWDEMAIDETCSEFESCLCFPHKELIDSLNLIDKILKE